MRLGLDVRYHWKSFLITGIFGLWIGHHNADLTIAMWTITALAAGPDSKCEYLWLSSKLGVDKFVNLDDVLLIKQDEADGLWTGFELLST